METLLRRIAELNTAVLPGGRIAFAIGPAQVGWLAPALAEALAAYPAITRTPSGLVLDQAAAADLPAIARDLARNGHMRHRHEAFDVRATPDGPVLSTIDRGALPAFGIEAQGIHLDGLVRRDDGWHIWIGRRAPTKALDPDKLDHITAGGIPAGLGPLETLVKEADEEAGMPEPLARQARRTGVLRYAMSRPEGLRRDLLHCYEVELPASFTPTPRDGEVANFTLWPLPRLAEALRDDADAFKFNVVVVLAGLLLRHGQFAGEDAARVRAALGEV
jgi:hypothetical protein